MDAMTRASGLADQAADRLRDWLRDGTLQPGTFYSVQQVADRLRISRSPAREAVVRLAEAGLVEFSRNRGFRLVVPAGRDVAEIFALRLALEPPAARRAATTASTTADTAGARSLTDRLQDLVTRMQAAAGAGDAAQFSRLDQRLHQAVMLAAGNTRAAAVIDRLRDATRALGPATAGRTRSLGQILDEHRPVVEAIGAGDPDGAEHAMTRHLLVTGRLLITQCHEDGDRHAWHAWRDLIPSELQ